MTSLTARHLRLADRGEIRIGAWGDVVVFDPQRVNDTATYEDPHRYPEGIEHVVVNGELALEAGATTPGRHGRFLRHGRDLGGA
jgi:N-acyl-D-aspartate/D-glutamate deacylase